MTTMLKIRDFELVVALHEEGTFTQAAKRVGVSQTALSKRLQLIERKLQARLFDRRYDGAMITESGRSFVSGAADIVHAFHRTIHAAQEAKHGEHRKLRIGVSLYLPSSLIDTIHSIELPLYKHLSVEIASGTTPELILDLQKRHVDLVLVTSPTPNPAITTQCIAVHNFMIAFRKGHPLAAKPFVTLNEIVEYPWVFFKRAIHPCLHDLVLRRVEAEQKQANIVHYGTHVVQASALLNDDSRIGWTTVAGVDFGTGYSALSYIAKLPFNALKIDRNFMKEIMQRSETRAMVQSVVLLAQQLGMKVIVEGIENEEQLGAIKEMGADGVQGYLLGRPTPDPATHLTHRLYEAVENAMRQGALVVPEPLTVP